MTYQEAIKYLESFINYERVPSYPFRRVMKLERMRKLLEVLDNPHKGLKYTHITGTKGKGSVSAILASVLKNQGLRVGLYTSPHLINFRERIRIVGDKGDNILGMDGVITEDELADLVTKLKDKIDSFNRASKYEELSFFEIYTALAFNYFSIKKPDIIILEVGIGGRLDATNVINSAICGISSISFEHTDKLGNTLSDIAREKCGIIHNECKVLITAPQEDEVIEVMKETCQKQNVKIYEVGKDISYELVSQDCMGEVFNVKGVNSCYDKLKLSLLGNHQIINACLAIGIAENLGIYNIEVTTKAIREGVAKVIWPGRLEIVQLHPAIILDGAQNIASARCLKETIKKFFKFRQVVLIFGVSKDKDVKGIYNQLEKIADEVILTQVKDNPRAQDPYYIKELINKRKDIDIKITLDLKTAIEKAKEITTQDDLILITGSLFLVGEAEAILNKKDAVSLL